MDRSNLTVETNAQVQRIVFEGKRAVGVEFKQGKQVRTVKANKEVLLSAGAFQSPQLLMLSGVGDSDELKKHGIPVVHHLPGVGKNLQDHPDFIFGYTTDSPATFGLSPGGMWRAMMAMGTYRKERRGLWTSNFAEAGAFLKTQPDLSAPDLQLHMVTALVDDHGRKMHFTQGYSCHVCLLRPRSRGSVQLASANPDDLPLIDPAFLEDPQDLEDMVQGYKITQKIMEAPSLKRWMKKDMFTANVKTDDDIRDVIRQRADTVYHPVGSCKMGTDEHAVVDPQLRVHGIEGLRVIDASIMPTLIGGNTNAPAMMIAEKAVDMIRGNSRVS
jgi:choline dehydrogenase-like flavoprotein